MTSKKTPLLKTCFLGWSIFQTLGIGFSAETGALLPARPYTVREGFPNVRQKLERGEPVRIVFLGGSITKNQNGFTSQVPAWLQKHYPNSSVNFVNAGISGTPSQFGAQRFDRDVLAEKPDLVFVEFAVNDGVSEATVHMERIVHKAWTHDPLIDLVFIYTLNAKDHLPFYEKGMLPPAASAHERVAEHYGIPSIGMAYAAAAKIRAGEMTVDEFAKDKVHPSPAGHTVYVDAITEGLREMLSGKAAPQAQAHSLKTPLADHFVLYPTPAKAEPLPDPMPLTAADGSQTVVAFAAPLPGKHWIEDPVFTVKGQPLWEMHVCHPEGKTIPGPKEGLDSREWNAPVKWFPEGPYFTGPDGRRLWGKDDAGRPSFATGNSDLPVLAFIAPVDGRYVFEARSAKMEYFGPPNNTACFNAVHVGWGEDIGQSVAHQILAKRDGPSLNVAGQVNMRAGEKLAFIITKNFESPVYLPDFQVTVGRLP